MSTNRDYSKIISTLKAKANAKGVTPEEKKTLEDKIAELEKKHPAPKYPYVNGVRIIPLEEFLKEHTNMPSPEYVKTDNVPSWVQNSEEYRTLYNMFYGYGYVDRDDIIEEEWQEQGDDEPW